MSVPADFSPPGVTVATALEMYHLDLPFKVRLVMTDHKSDKFWEATYRGGGSHVVHIRWGRRGTHGQSLDKDFAYLSAKAAQKLKSGYRLDGPVQALEYHRQMEKARLREAAEAPPVLEFPYNLIRRINVLPNDAGGTALDENGAFLLKLTAAGVRELCVRDNIAVFGATANGH